MTARRYGSDDPLHQSNVARIRAHYDLDDDRLDPDTREKIGVLLAEIDRLEDAQSEQRAISRCPRCGHLTSGQPVLTINGVPCCLTCAGRVRWEVGSR